MTSIISLMLSPVTSLLHYVGGHLLHFLHTPMTSKPDALTYREALFLYTIRWYCMYTPMSLLFPVPLFKALGVVASWFFDTNVQYVEPSLHPFKGYWYDNTYAKHATPDHPAYRKQHSETAGTTPRVMLFMHGGALISGTSRQYPYIFNYFINEALQKYNIHLRILSVEYTLLNQKTKYEGVVNEKSINECMHAYDYLLQQCHVPADEIIFCGDSCGGQLAILLALLCRDGQSFVSHKAVKNGKNGQQQISTDQQSNGNGSNKPQSRPMPRCIVTGSPWVDVSKDLLGNDDVCRDFFTRKIAVAWDDWHVGIGGDSHNPLLSPLHASLRMPLPPMFICYGKKEMLRTSIEHFITKARKSGLMITEYADDRLFHIFPFVSDFIGPNGFKALDQMIQYMFSDKSHSKVSPHSTHVN